MGRLTAGLTVSGTFARRGTGTAEVLIDGASASGRRYRLLLDIDPAHPERFAAALAAAIGVADGSELPRL